MYVFISILAIGALARRRVLCMYIYQKSTEFASAHENHASFAHIQHLYTYYLWAYECMMPMNNANQHQFIHNTKSIAALQTHLKIVLCIWCVSVCSFLCHTTKTFHILYTYVCLRFFLSLFTFYSTRVSHWSVHSIWFDNLNKIHWSNTRPKNNVIDSLAYHSGEIANKLEITDRSFRRPNILANMPILM